MPSPLLSLIQNRLGGRRAVETFTPRRTFADVILPPATRATLDQALAQVRSQALIFDRWGLGERHATGLGLAFNFAGPPGTGKTVCAEAIAHALGRQLFLVNYAEVESMWAGETPKNVAAVFRAAGEQNAVLFFDEADAIAARRTGAGAALAFQRESNTTVNVLLKELEAFNGVVIFATNLAANFDPAFARRVRTHVLFEMPGPDEREQIWRVQVHPLKTPLAPDVDFRALAERFAGSGGDIKNAVLKAAVAAAAEPGPDDAKAIRQVHFERAMEEVISAKRVMRQSVLDPEVPELPASNVPAPNAPGGAPGDPAALTADASSLGGQVAQLVQAAEARWRALALGAAGLAAVALLAAVAALGAAFSR